MDGILQKYKGHEEVLFHKLSKKYGIECKREPEIKAVPNNGRDISGRHRAEEVGRMQKSSTRNKEERVMGKLLKNQIELENRVSRLVGTTQVAPGNHGNQGNYY